MAKSKLLGFVVVLLLASLVFTACAPGWYWKAGDLIDYAPSGVPDFDQKQDVWKDSAGQWSYCGPVAVANSFWWFDSKFEPNPIAPPAVNDGYPLVESNGSWDDHYLDNVIPLVEDLAFRMDTDGQRTGGKWNGTKLHDMYDAIDRYLIDKGLSLNFTRVMAKSPEYSWIVQEVERCEDVILLLGFWQFQDNEWVRIGGHYVTVAGVNSEKSQIGISDPYRDSAEAGSPGIVPASHAYPHDPRVHNDAKYVSHDFYDVVRSDSPGGRWALKDYAEGWDISNFIDQNWADDLLPYRQPYLRTDLPVQTEVDYAIAVSPREVEYVPPTPTPTPTIIVPTPTPTGIGHPTPTPTSTGEGRPTPTPTATPTPEAAETPTPTPADPCVDTFWMYHEEGGPALGVTVHLLPGCGLEGQVFDIHILIDDTMFHEQVYQTPMEICNKYVYIYELPPGVDFIEGGNLYMEGFEGGYPSTVWVELTCRAHSVLKKIKVPYRE